MRTSGALSGGQACGLLLTVTVLGLAALPAAAQTRFDATGSPPSQAAIVPVPRVAHPYDPSPFDAGGAALAIPQPDAYRKPYEQYLGGWREPPPTLVSSFVPGPSPGTSLPQLAMMPAQQPVPAAPQLAQAAPPPAPVHSPAPLHYGEGSVLGVSELRFGILAHNYGPIADHVEHGAQINLEARFRSPDFMKLVLSPRPTLGASINTAGDTSFLYTGLTWGGFVWKGLFIEGFFGLATHDGQLNSHDPEPHDRRQLGSRVLFREAIEIGYRFLDNHSVSIMLDHVSNAGLLADRNQGNDDVGLRYGYKF